MTKRKTFSSRATAFITAMLIMLLVLPTEIVTVFAADANVTVTDVVLTVEGEPLNGQTLSNGDDIAFSFNWKLSKTSDDPFTNPITIQFDFDGMELENIGGDLKDGPTTIGTYVITNGNTIQFTLFDEMLSESEITGQCNFNGKVQFDIGDISSDNKIDILVKHSETVYIDQTVPVIPEGNLTMDKAASGNVYSEGSNYYQDYTVTINATGTSASILNQITDTPGELGGTLDPSKGITVTTTGTVTGISDTYNSFSDISDITMELGSQIVLSYRMIISENVFSAGGDLWKYNNTAKVTYNNTFEISDNATPSLVWSEVSKNGSGPDSDGLITWTVTIVHNGFTGNADADRLICSAINDTLTGNHEFVTAAPTLNDIIAASNYGNEWEHKYTYSYKTKIDEEETTADRDYTNTIYVTLDGATRNASDTVTVEGSVPVVKSATDSSINSDKTMGWEVTYTVPSNTTELTITDVPTASGGKSHSIVSGSVAVTVNGVTSNAYTVSGNNIVFDPSVLTAGNVIVVSYDTLADGDFTTEGVFSNKAKAVYVQSGETITKESNDASYPWDTINAVTKTDSYVDLKNKLAWEIKINLKEITDAGYTLKAGDVVTLDDVLTRTYTANDSAPMPTFTSIYYGAANNNSLVDKCLENLSINAAKDKFTFTITQDMIDGGLEWFTFRYRMDFENVNTIVDSNYRNTVTATYIPNGESGIPAGTSFKDSWISPNPGAIIDKSHQYPGNGAIVPYTVKVNESEVDLSTDDTVTLTDVFCDSLYLIPSTLAVKDGITSAALDDALWSYKYDTSTNTLTVELPDMRYCIVTYSAGVDVSLEGVAQVKLPLTNSASLEYKTGDPFDKNHTWTATLLKGSATITYNSGSIVVNKSDMVDNSNLINGATFRLIPGYFNTSGLFTPYTNKILHPTVEKEIDYSTGNDTIENLELEGILYQMTEIAAPAGYKIDPSPRYIVIKKPGDAEPAISNNVNNYPIEYLVIGSTIMIENEPADPNEQRFPVKVKKIEATGKTALAGATLTLYTSSDVIVDTWETTTATHTVNNLLPGTYKLVETAAPDGYKIASPITFVISDTGEVSINGTKIADGVVTMEDKPSVEPTYVIKFQKFIKDTQTALEGAKLQLKNKTTGAVVAEWTSTTAAYEAELKSGTYILKEVTPPTGYKTASDIEFIVAADGTVTINSVEETDKIIEMYDEAELYSVTFSKTDESAINLAGATLQLLNSESKVIEEWTTTDDVKTITDLAAGTYTLKEKSAPTGYNAAADITFVIADDGTITRTDNENITDRTIVMIDTVEKTSISVEKVWNDNDNQDGKRSDSVTINLLADGTVAESVTLSSTNSWKHVFTDLDKFNAGKPIAYTIEEITVPSYSTAVTGDADNGFTVTNTYSPEKTSISVEKVWNDNDNQDGKRSDSVTINLLADGTVAESVTLSNTNSWKHVFTGLDKFNAGKPIAYTIEEITVSGYSTAVTGDADNGFTVTNSYTPETIDVSIKKVWNDNNDQDGLRPGSITVKLLADGTEIEEAVLSGNNGWTKKFEDLPKNKAGTAINYTWREISVEGYTSSSSTEGTLTTLTNTHIPETTEATITKIWDDNENQDGKRPAELVVTLSNGDKVTLNEANGWTATIDNLPKYSNGNEIVYSWSENVPAGYELTKTTVNGTVTTLTNSHTPEVTSATVTKVWDDENNKDGRRPESLKVTLSNGTEVTLSELNNWTTTVNNLPKYADGQVIKYTWTEVIPDGYSLTDTTVNGTITTLTNSHTPEPVNVRGVKTWDDIGFEQERPANITVNLYGNGSYVKSMTVNASTNWSYSFTDLKKYEDGKEIVYTVTEDTVYGYTPVYNGYNIENKYTYPEIAVQVTKNWNDDNNRDGKRPESITVKLLENGIYKNVSVELTADKNWTHVFDHLPAKDSNDAFITYTVEEVIAAPYSLEKIDGSTETGYVIINKYTPETTSATVTKVWNDANNQDGKRPANLAVTLSNGDKVTLNEANGWTATIDNLPKYANGNVIEYTWTESDMPDGYTLTKTEVNGTVTTLTNTYIAATVDVSIKKIWNDNNNEAGKRPANLVVTLSDGTVVILDDANGWTATVKNLPKYANGTEIQYTWTEGTMPEGYTLTKTDVNGTVTTLTNTYTNTPGNNNPVIPEAPDVPVVPNVPNVPNIPVKPFIPITPDEDEPEEEDVSSESSIGAEADTIGNIDTTSYTYIAILLAITAGGILIARRRQK